MMYCYIIPTVIQHNNPFIYVRFMQEKYVLLFYVS